MSHMVMPGTTTSCAGKIYSVHFLNCSTPKNTMFAKTECNIMSLRFSYNIIGYTQGLMDPVISAP